MSAPAIHVLLQRAFANKRDVIQAIGDVMVSHGDVTRAYVDGMLRKEQAGSTWLTDDIALPHGTNDVKGAVLRNSIVIVQLPAGIEWGNGKIVRLAIGVAGAGDTEHVRVLGAIARLLKDKALVDRLVTADDEQTLTAMLQHR